MAFSLLFNQHGIIARSASEDKGKAIRDPLTDAAVVMDCDLGIPGGLHNERLVACEGQSIRGFGMQNILARHERNVEAAAFIRLELSDLYPAQALDRQRGLIRLVGTFLSRLDDGAHRPEEHLPFDSTAPRRGAIDGAGRKHKDQYTNEELDIHRALLLSIFSTLGEPDLFPKMCRGADR